MRRRILIGVVAVAALAVAAILALLADTVLETRDGLDARADALAQTDAPSEPGLPSSLRFRAARALLGVEGETELVETIARYDRTLAADLAPERQLELHAEAEAELARLVRGGEDRALRSLAANLNGVLLVRDAELDRRSSTRFLQLGLESFRRAVTLDPENEEAKFNLELLAALLTGGDGRVGDDSGSQGASGAGASPGGSGY